MTRKTFVATMAAITAAGFPVAALPRSEKIDPRPHGSIEVRSPNGSVVEDNWCHCEECEAWDDYLEVRVTQSVDEALELFWKSVTTAYGLKGPVPVFVPAEELKEAAFCAVRDWVEAAAGAVGEVVDA